MARSLEKKTRDNTWQKTADNLENMDGGCVQYVISFRRKKRPNTKGEQAAGVEKNEYNYINAIKFRSQFMEHRRMLSTVC